MRWRHRALDLSVTGYRMNSQTTAAWQPASSHNLLTDLDVESTGFIRNEGQKQRRLPLPLPLLLTIGVHAVALGWLLFGNSGSTQPAPLDAVNVTMIEMSQPTPEPMEVQEPDPVIVPKAVVPQPEIEIEMNQEPTTAIRQVTQVASAAPSKPVDAVPITQPRFDADYLNNPAPVYPAMSRRMHERGEVRLRVLVSKDGMPVEVQVERSCGYSRLDQAALAAVRKWKFQPAQRGGVSVDAWVIVPIEFDMQSRA